jgi:hypothetical protein
MAGYQKSRVIPNLKYVFAFLCFAYIASAFLPGCSTHARDCPPTVYSAWLGRALFIIDGVLFAAAFLCMQIRKPICWKLIPVLLGGYWLTYILPGFWFPPKVQHAWVPEMALVIITVVGVPAFVIWWRNQKSYFAEKA